MKLHSRLKDFLPDERSRKGCLSIPPIRRGVKGGGVRGGGKEKVKWLTGDGRAKGYARSINLAIWMEWL